MNIHDVARLAGVSLATASKALNGRRDVAEATRQRVVQAAQSIHYRPDPVARSQARKKTGVIALVTLRRAHDPLSVNPFYSRVVEGIEAECAARSAAMAVASVPWAEDGSVPPLPKAATDGSADGLLLLGAMPEAFIAQAAALPGPMVVVDCQASGVPAHYFVSNNEAGARMVAEHFKARGHHRLGMVTAALDDFSFGKRKEGFVRACLELGLGAPKVVAARREQRPDQMEWMLPMLQGGESRPTAVFCCNDNHAEHFMALCRREGLSVPSDVAVAGYDDIEAAERLDPPLTTVRVPKQDLGRKAAQRLFGLIARPDRDAEVVTLPVEMVERASSGAGA